MMKKNFCSGEELRNACVGHYGRNFRKKDTSGLWTFLYDVPGDMRRGVFRDGRGLTRIESYEELAPLLSRV